MPFLKKEWTLAAMVWQDPQSVFELSQKVFTQAQNRWMDLIQLLIMVFDEELQIIENIWKSILSQKHTMCIEKVGCQKLVKNYQQNKSQKIL